MVKKEKSQDPMRRLIERKAATPPYLSASKIDEVFRLVENRNFKKVSASYFKEYKFTVVDAALAVSMLRFLNLIDGDGIPTEQMGKIRLIGEAREKGFLEIVRSAYHELFDRSNSAQDLKREDLMNEFINIYRVSKRIASSAILAFLKLCEYAGLRHKGSARKKISVTNNKKRLPKSFDRTFEKLERDRFAPIRVAEGRMVLSVPPELKDRLLDEDTLGQDWIILRVALRVFADKYLPTSNQSAPHSVDIGN